MTRSDFILKLSKWLSRTHIDDNDKLARALVEQLELWEALLPPTKRLPDIVDDATGLSYPHYINEWDQDWRE